MKKYDLSIHFTIKGQTVAEIESKLNAWLDSDKYLGQFDFSEKDEEEPRTVLHHCFLPKKVVEQKGWSTDVWDFLETISEDIVCWNGVWNDGDALVWDRVMMLRNIIRTDGISIFIGNIIEGVKEEYDIAQEMGIECIVIP